MHSVSKNQPKRRDRAFTLVEMLVVIAIMSILMTVGAIGLGGMGGKGVSSGVATAESLFDEARSIAVGQRTKSRVLIAKDLTNSGADNLRRILVASQVLDANGLPTSNWALSSRGAILPEQVYFSKKFSLKDHDAGSGTLDEMDVTTAMGKVAYVGKYYYYEFNAEGICATPGASFVIGTGSRGLTTSAVKASPKVNAAGKRDFAGFVVWRNGRTSVFRSPSQISSTIDSLTTGTEF